MEQIHTNRHCLANSTSAVSGETTHFSELPNNSRFRELRQGLKISQTGAAERCGCSTSSISKWEKGQFLPAVELQRKLRRFQHEMENSLNQNVVGTKRCWDCKRKLPISAFAQDKARKSGVQSKCRDCNFVYSTDWLEKNRQKVNRQRKQKRRKHDAKRLSSSKWTSTQFRDISEFKELGKGIGLNLRNKITRSFYDDPKSAAEIRADEILDANGFFNSETEPDCRWDEVGMDAENYGHALRELRLENRILENHLWRLTALYMKRLGAATQRRILAS